MNVEDLPPPYIPVIFSLLLIAGVGVLTSSLGDVVGDEAQLGDRSGARAKKELEKGRSSFLRQK